MIKLAVGYDYSVDDISEDSWYDLIGQFSDASIFQTWAYGRVRRGDSNTSHIVLRKQGNPVACAQVMVARIPIFPGKAIAFARWAPLWQRKGAPRDFDVFRQVIRTLRIEYALKRRYLLRLYPLLFDSEPEPCRSIMIEEGFALNSSHIPQRTLLLDLAPSMEDMRKGLKQKWRNCLNSADRAEQTVTESSDDTLFDDFLLAYREMYGRKKLTSTTEVDEFKLIQHQLPDQFKMKILTAEVSGQLAASLVCSNIGGTGIYLLGATTNFGMKTKSSYLLQWKILEWLKLTGSTVYNLNGINPETNPGTYRFKAGLAGKDPVEVSYLGQFDSCQGHFNRLMCRSVECLWNRYSAARTLFKRLVSNEGT